MITARAGERLNIARNECAVVSLPVYDGGTLWAVESAEVTLADSPLAVTIAEGIASATIEPQTDLKTATLKWALAGSDTTERIIETQVEVIGAHLCSIADIRAYNSNANVDGFADTTKYPDSMIFEARQLATSIIEDACGVHFSQRLKKHTTFNRGKTQILPDVCVQSVSVENGTAYLVSDRQVLVYAEMPATISYICGHLSCPSDVRQAVIKLAAVILRPLNRPEAATGESTELGYISYTLAGRDGATGIPEVDAVIQRRRIRRVEIW